MMCISINLLRCQKAGQQFPCTRDMPSARQDSISLSDLLYSPCACEKERRLDFVMEPHENFMRVVWISKLKFGFGFLWTATAFRWLIRKSMLHGFMVATTDEFGEDSAPIYHISRPC